MCAENTECICEQMHAEQKKKARTLLVTADRRNGGWLELAIGMVNEGM